jgi:hypothetical protein
MKHDPLSPTFVVELGGKTRRMVFDLNTFAAFEEAAGPDVLFIDAVSALYEAIKRIQESKPDGGLDFSFADAVQLMRALPMSQIRALVWAALHSDDPSLTVVDVGRMIHPANLMGIIRALLSGQAANAPEQDDAAPDPPPSRPIVAPLEVSGGA